MDYENSGETAKFIKPELAHKVRLFDKRSHVKAIFGETFDKLTELSLKMYWAMLLRDKMVVVL